MIGSRAVSINKNPHPDPSGHPSPKSGEGPGVRVDKVKFANLPATL